MYKIQLIATICFVLLFIQSSFALPLTNDGSTDNQKHLSREDRSIRELGKEKEKVDCKLCWKIGKNYVCKTLLQTNSECANAKKTDSKRW